MCKAFLNWAQMYKEIHSAFGPKCYKIWHLSIRLLWSEIWWSCDQSSFFPLCFLTTYFTTCAHHNHLRALQVKHWSIAKLSSESSESSESNSDSSWKHDMSFFFFLKTWVPRALNMINIIFSTHTCNPLSLCGSGCHGLLVVPWLSSQKWFSQI
jgi:hypothetical protein